VQRSYIATVLIRGLRVPTEALDALLLRTPSQTMLEGRLPLLRVLGRQALSVLTAPAESARWSASADVQVGRQVADAVYESLLLV
jgi:hypothetical protein